MKKVAVIPAVVLAALCTFTGCKKEEVEKVIAPLVSDGQTTESTEEAQEEKDPLIPEIDTSVELQAGSRVAVVSKSTSGEFWGLVKKGMEQAIADVNEAYGFKKEDQVTMTFEGASDEKDVESQVNTIDAVIAIFLSFLSGARVCLENHSQNLLQIVTHILRKAFFRHVLENNITSICHINVQ